jgi:hypothetical protein
MAKKPYIPTMYDTRLVFAAASAAQRINGSYVKSSESRGEKPSNRAIMNFIVMGVSQYGYEVEVTQNWSIMDLDYVSADQIMEYYKSKTLEIMSGKANAYTMAAANAAYKEQIASNDQLTLGTVASLPQAHERSVAYDQTWDRVELLKRNSQHFGTVGDKFEGAVEVLSCIYSKNWFKYYVTAITKQGNIVNFASDGEYKQGETVEISSAKIKQHANENITRLHYVRVKRENKVDTEA